MKKSISAQKPNNNLGMPLGVNYVSTSLC
jgi:hypothetical protein